MINRSPARLMLASSKLFTADHASTKYNHRPRISEICRRVSESWIQPMTGAKSIGLGREPVAMRI